MKHESSVVVFIIYFKIFSTSVQEGSSEKSFFLSLMITKTSYDLGSCGHIGLITLNLETCCFVVILMVGEGPWLSGRANVSEPGRPGFDSSSRQLQVVALLFISIEHAELLHSK